MDEGPAFFFGEVWVLFSSIVGFLVKRTYSVKPLARSNVVIGEIWCKTAFLRSLQEQFSYFLYTQVSAIRVEAVPTFKGGDIREFLADTEQGQATTETEGSKVRNSVELNFRGHRTPSLQRIHDSQLDDNKVISWPSIGLWNHWSKRFNGEKEILSAHTIFVQLRKVCAKCFRLRSLRLEDYLETTKAMIQEMSFLSLFSFDTDSWDSRCNLSRSKQLSPYGI